MTIDRGISRRGLIKAALAAGGAAYFTRGIGHAETSMTLNERMTGDIAFVHDPCIIKAGDTYYVYSTGPVEQRPDGGLIPLRTSKDLVSWQERGSVFKAVPKWVKKAVPGVHNLWAPDISHFNGRYHLYYACSTFGSNHSVIGLATNVTLDPDAPNHEWMDEGPVIASERGDDFNAIDANHFIDQAGHHWLCLGSFWSGIKLFPIDPATGKPPAGDKRKYSLAARPVPEHAPGAIEAPFMIERGGFYYLFVAFDYCCRGVSSSYYVVVGRSRKVEGPYVGPDGKPMLGGYGMLVLEGNRRFRGPGHPAVLRDPDQDYLVFHAYDAEHDGRPTLRISPIAWSEDGWPTVKL